MTTISASDVKNRIGDLWGSADKVPVVVERNGQPRYLATAAFTVRQTSRSK